MNNNEPLLKVENLKKYYILKNNPLQKGRILKVVDDISFDIYEGETLGLVGDAGCGKTTTGELILRLIEPDDGRVYFKNKDILKLKKAQMRSLRKDMQVIFQNSREVLDPKMTVGELLEEPIKIHFNSGEPERKQRVYRLLDMVELSSKDALKYSYQMSGGQKQRVLIGRALAVEPSFIVCDEIVSALDVSVQGQILNLLKGLKKEFNMTYLFISHDIKVINFMCNRILKMEKGKISTFKIN